MLTEDLLGRLQVATEAIHQCILAEMDKGETRRLSVAQMMVVVRMARVGNPLPAKSIKRQSYVGSNISYTLALLVKGGYLQLVKQSSDGRVCLHEVTDKGKQLAAKVEPILAHIEKYAGDQFSVGQVAQVTSATRMIGVDYSPRLSRTPKGVSTPAQTPQQQ